MTTWTNVTYPLGRMIKDLTGPGGNCYPKDLDGMSEQQIRDLYADAFPPFPG